MYKDFNKQKRSMIGSSIFLGIINLILKLAFWLGLFAGGIWILYNKLIKNVFYLNIDKLYYIK